MRELMLKLLTYEPFEKISGDEKKYIDAVLNNDVTENRKYPLYHSLMFAFKRFCDKGGESKILAIWFRHFYIFSKSGKIGVLCDKKTGDRTYYPVLFKKICVYCILYKQLTDNTRDNASNAKFFSDFGMRENILNKWHMSTKYMFLANQDTYSTFRIDRNGLKKPYLTKVIKKIYYESGNQRRQYADTAKKYELETFVDVFSATGTVAASVNAKNVSCC